MSKQFYFKQFKFCISSIEPIYRILSGATTPDRSRRESKGNKEVSRIPQSSSITEASPSDCLGVSSWYNG